MGETENRLSTNLVTVIDSQVEASIQSCLLTFIHTQFSVIEKDILHRAGKEREGGELASDNPTGYLTRCILCA